MWLPNATAEQRRKGLAGYLFPDVPIAGISGEGDGMFGGGEVATLEAFEDMLLGRDGESLVYDRQEPAGPEHPSLLPGGQP